LAGNNPHAPFLKTLKTVDEFKLGNVYLLMASVKERNVYCYIVQAVQAGIARAEVFIDVVEAREFFETQRAYISSLTITEQASDTPLTGPPMNPVH
jgi:hypothetical protein